MPKRGPVVDIRALIGWTFQLSAVPVTGTGGRNQAPLQYRPRRGYTFPTDDHSLFAEVIIRGITEGV